MLIACEQTGRDARLMELDPRYCDVIVKRWQDFTGKAATLEGDAAQRSPNCWQSARQKHRRHKWQRAGANRSGALPVVEGNFGSGRSRLLS